MATPAERERPRINPETLRTVVNGNSRLLEKARGASRDGYLPAREAANRAFLQIQFHDETSAFTTLSDVRWPTNEVTNAWIKIADVQRERGDSAGAHLALEKALKVASQVHEVRDGYNVSGQYIGVSEAYARLGDADKAIATLDWLKESGLDTGRDNTLLRVVISLAGKGNEAGAFKAAAAAGSDNYKRFCVGFIAQQYARNGDFAAWQRVMQASVPTNLGTVRAYVGGAEFFAQSGDQTNAGHFLDQAVRTLAEVPESENIKDHWRLQLVEFALEKMNAPQAALEIVAQMPLDLITTYTYSDIAEVQHKLGDTDAVLTTLEEVKRKIDEIPEGRRQDRDKPWSKIDVAGVYMKIGHTGEGEAELEGVNLSGIELTDAISRQSSRGHFEVALQLADKLPPRQKGAIYTEIARDMLQRGQVEQVGQLLDYATGASVAEVEQAREENKVRVARESDYSLGGIARLYAKTGDSEKARQTLDKLFEILYATRDADNRYWYNNTIYALVQNSAQVKAFDIAARAISEISWPVLKSEAHTRIANGLLEEGVYEDCITQLKLAEQEADKIKPREEYKSETYLAVSNTYYQLQKLLDKSS